MFKVAKSITTNAPEDAVLVGAIDPPALTIRQAFSRFKELSPVKGKHPNEVTIFWGRYELAVEGFVLSMGDMDVMKITDGDAKNIDAFSRSGWITTSSESTQPKRG